MFKRSVLSLMSLALLGWCVSLLAAENQTHHGIIVSVAENKLVMSDMEGNNEQTHLVPPTTKVVLDGHDVKIMDLQKGDVVKVDANSAGKVATVDATRSDKVHEGLIVSAGEGKVVMTDKEGKNEHSHEVGPAAKITLDAKAAKLSDLKKGDAVKVAISKMGEVSSIAATRKEKA